MGLQLLHLRQRSAIQILTCCDIFQKLTYAKDTKMKEKVWLSQHGKIINLQTIHSLYCQWHTKGHFSCYGGNPLIKWGVWGQIIVNIIKLRGRVFISA